MPAEASWSSSHFSASNEPQEHVIFPELEFFEPSLADAASELVEVPQLERDLLPSLRMHRLLVFGGLRVSEKLLFAKNLAWLLANSLNGQGGGELCKVLQWHPQPGLIQLSSALDRGRAGTIFLFPGLEPHHLGGYDLRRLLEDLGRHQQFAILTTDSEPDRWSPAADWIERKIWFDASQMMFAPELLIDMLRERLGELAERWPADFRERIPELTAETRLVGQLSAGEVARQLKTPGKIRSFVVALSLIPNLSETKAREALKELLDERHAVHLWYRQLEPRDQLLVLGLVLMEGILDDQLFSGLEILVQNAWRDWDPSLAHFDYHELARAAPYFLGTKEQKQTTRIECLSRHCREALLEVAWLLHRRRILATLPVLADIVRDASTDTIIFPETRNVEKHNSGNSDADSPDSTGGGAPLSEDDTRASRWYQLGRSRDLFGNPIRNLLLQWCTAETLSQVGRISSDAVDSILLDLAQDDRLSVQAVAASALARWRELDPGGKGDKRLSDLLNAWQEDSFEREYAQYRWRRYAAARPFANVRATIALTVGRAALYDPPNCMNAELVALFDKLVTDRNRVVRFRFRNDSLPLLVAAHLLQLEKRLWDSVLPQNDLLFSTAIGLAYAHRFRPQEALPILKRWHQNALAISAVDPDEEKRRQRTHALIIVALTYGLVRPGDGQGSIPASQIFKVLKEFLATENHPLIRTAVMSAMIRHAQEDLAQVAAQLQEIVSELSLEERLHVVVLFTDLYLKQRRALGHQAAKSRQPGPDTEETLGGSRYGLWIESQRPRTKIELTLEIWLGDPWRPEAVQIALECLESFADTPVEKRERELREGAQRETPNPTIVTAVAGPPQLETLRTLDFAGRLAVLIAAPLNAQLRGLLWAGLPELLIRLEARHSGLPLLELSEVRKDPLLVRLEEANPQLASQLARAGWIYLWRRQVLAAAVVLLGLLAGAALVLSGSAGGR